MLKMNSSYFNRLKDLLKDSDPSVHKSVGLLELYLSILNIRNTTTCLDDLLDKIIQLINEEMRNLANEITQSDSVPSVKISSEETDSKIESVTEELLSPEANSNAEKSENIRCDPDDPFEEAFCPWASPFSSANSDSDLSS